MLDNRVNTESCFLPLTTHHLQERLKYADESASFNESKQLKCNYHFNGCAKNIPISDLDPVFFHHGFFSDSVFKKSPFSS